MSAESTSKTPKSFKIKPQQRKKRKELDIYSSAIITKDIFIPIVNVGANIKETLQRIIACEIEGKCISEGYVKSESVKIISYSNGIVNSSYIQFQVIFECKVCYPVEGMNITCIAKNITKAGIRAELSEVPNPVVIFIARDHNYMSKNFSLIQEDQQIKVRVIGQRYELNDTYISVIGELVSDIQSLSHTPKLKIKDILTVSPASPSIEPPAVSPIVSSQEASQAASQEASPTVHIPNVKISIPS